MVGPSTNDVHLKNVVDHGQAITARTFGEPRGLHVILARYILSGMRYALGTSVGERGQITIEREIRKRLGIKPKDLAVQRVEDGRLVVEFVRPHEPHMRSVAGILGPSPKRPREPLDLDSSVGRGIADEWRRTELDDATSDDKATQPEARRRRSP